MKIEDKLYGKPETGYSFEYDSGISVSASSSSLISRPRASPWGRHPRKPRQRRRQDFPKVEGESFPPAADTEDAPLSRRTVDEEKLDERINDMQLDRAYKDNKAPYKTREMKRNFIQRNDLLVKEASRLA